MNDVDKFWANVEKTDTCWLWKGGRSTGYGTLVFEGESISAHRVSLMLATGHRPLPGLVIMHLCNVKSCVNPDHLRVGSPSDNIRAAHADGLFGRHDPAVPSTHKLRLPQDLYDWICAEAERQCRTKQQQILYLLKIGLDKIESSPH